LQYAPVLFFFPATTGPYAASSGEPTTYDFNTLGFEGPDVASTLSQQLGIRIPYSKPVNWKAAGTFTLGFFAFASLLYTFVPKILSNESFGFGLIWKIFLQAAILLTIVIMCAGQMWNSIRNAPYMSVNANGKAEYFAGGFQNQYGAETQIVALVCEFLLFLQNQRKEVS
jgi:oligosaccharyltransferase complex subunit gamma